MPKMSDGDKKENVALETQHDQQPEYWNKLSIFLNIFLPVAGLAILLKQKQIFSRLLLQLDRSCLSVFCPVFSRREKLLKWAGSRLPEKWSSQSKTLAGGVAELWSDGSLLCTLINSAIPGACPNPHRHWKKPPLHAQAIAYKYLGVVPIFTENDLTGPLTIRLERNFLHYLNELQHAFIKLSERDDAIKCVSDHYVARGMGLYTGEQHRKTIFYVYPNMKDTCSNSNVIIHIRGPYDTYGKALIPKFHNDLFPTPEINVISDSIGTTKLLQKGAKKNVFVKTLSLSFIRYHKKHMGDNIVIDISMEDKRAKVTYIPKNYGMYEINMISNGELIRGSPFNVHILNNTSGIEDNFEIEEKQNQLPSVKKRKVISKTIDFIDEQIPIADFYRRYNSCEDVNKEEKQAADKSKHAHKDPEEIRGSIETMSDSGRGNSFEEIEPGHLLDIEETAFEEETSTLKQGEEKIEEEEADIIPQLRNEISEFKFKTNIDSVLEDQSVSENTSEQSQDVPLEINKQAGRNTYKVNACNNKPSTEKVINNGVLCEITNDRLTQETNSKLSENDEIDSSLDSLEHNEVKINLLEAIKRRNTLADLDKLKSIPRRFFHSHDLLEINLETPCPNLNNQKNTSPICPDHIVPEVDNGFRKMSVAEKRKIFARQAPQSIPSSPNSSFSESESAESSKSQRHFRHFDGLRVLNYLGSLKQSEQSKPPNYSLGSTISLPDISSMEFDIFQNSVKERKMFWEKMSSSVSSLNINIDRPLQRKPKQVTEVERCRLIWKKPDETTVSSSNRSLPEKRYDIWKSADDIHSIASIIPYENSKIYRSLDNCLDKCTMLSVEERKKMLLKKNYEKEKLGREKLNSLKKNSIKRSYSKNMNKIIEERNERKNYDTIFAPIMDKIKIYDKDCTLTTTNDEKTSEPHTNSGTTTNISKNLSPILDKIKIYDKACTLTTTKDEMTNGWNTNSGTNINISKNYEYIHNDFQNLPPEKVTMKSHFKRAVKYFKKLEEKSLGKTKLSPKEDCRRLSLEIQPINKSNTKGGLNNFTMTFSEAEDKALGVPQI